MYNIQKRKLSLAHKLVFNDDNEITYPISIANYFNNYFVAIGEKLKSLISVAKEDKVY